MGESNAELEEMADESAEVKQQLASKNGKKAEGGAGGSFFTWFMVLALLGVWTSVAVVWFDLVDYQGAIGKLGSYDADGDGDFDMEDAKVLLEEKPVEVARRERPRESSINRDPAGKLREALKRQLALIHERVEAKKIARLALAEVRGAIAREEEARQADRAAGAKREEATALKAREKTEAKIRKAVEEIEQEELEKAEEELRDRAKRERGRAERDREEEEEKEKRAKRGREEKNVKVKRPPSKKKERDNTEDDDDERVAGKKGQKRPKEARAIEKRKPRRDSGKGGKK